MPVVIERPRYVFSGLLKEWRSRRRLSQLDLSLEAGLSQRHISFLETGRSKPSRYAIFQLGEAMNMPAAEVDALLLSAGFAARNSDTRWGAETRHAVDLSIVHVLKGHEPYPAVAIDRIWNIQKANSAAQRFFEAFDSSGDANLLRVLMKPGQLRQSIINWEETVRALIRLFELEVARRPNDHEAQGLLEELRSIPGVREATREPLEGNPPPVLSIQFRVGETTLKLFSMIATIGMSSDAALDDIRIETLLPSDDETRNWFANSF